MSLFRQFYRLYSLTVFISIFFLLFPIFSIGMLLNRKTFGLILSRYWCIWCTRLMGIKVVIENQDQLSKNENYIFCPNHFSFFDILTMPILSIPFRFVGKLSLSKIPLFGLYYRKFHITVDRDSLKSSYQAYQNSIHALEDGYSLTVFPEGGICTTGRFQMSHFKRGPFKMAIETNTKLVPITIADNWKILPDDGKYNLMKMKTSRILVHDPIDPNIYKGDIEKFQLDVYNLIQGELNLRNG